MSRIIVGVHLQFENTSRRCRKDGLLKLRDIEAKRLCWASSQSSPTACCDTFESDFCVRVAKIKFARTLSRFQAIQSLLCLGGDTGIIYWLYSVSSLSQYHLHAKGQQATWHVIKGLDQSNAPVFLCRVRWQAMHTTATDA